eukprot:gene13654-18324_t
MTQIILILANGIIACSYLILTGQIIHASRNCKVIVKDTKKDSIFKIRCLAVLFALFILLCGITHLNHFVLLVKSDSNMAGGPESWSYLVVMVSCAIVSFATCLVGFRVFPLIIEMVNLFEMSSCGRIVSINNYLVKAVELCENSIMIVSKGFIATRGNPISAKFFGIDFVNNSILRNVHEDDVEKLLSVAETIDSSPIPLVVSFRCVVNENYYGNSTPKSTGLNDLESGNENRTDVISYRWVEAKFCVPLLDDYLNAGEMIMITTDITDRRVTELQQEQNMLHDQINAAKLSYITCTAHDLKTPLQTFSFAIDLLKRSRLTGEQSELIDQAAISVDLMKLTISQTIDIGKVTSGKLLAPRKVTVSLKDTMHRISVIIDGYGKQVPVTYEISQDVFDY